LSGGVMVAQESLELFVMVRIHAGQPSCGCFFAGVVSKIIRPITY
jgi:hypothetical protein